MAVAPPPTYDEVYDFLLSSPTPEEVIAFRPSDATREKVQSLLEANKRGTLTDAQRHELDEFEQVEHFVRMLKIKARQKIQNA